MPESNRGLAETRLAKFKCGTLVETAKFNDFLIFQYNFHDYAKFSKSFENPASVIERGYS